MDPHQHARRPIHPSSMRYGPPEKLREIVARTAKKHCLYRTVGALVSSLKHAVVALCVVPGLCLYRVRDSNLYFVTKPLLCVTLDVIQ